jgi:hypothetical protein
MAENKNIWEAFKFSNETKSAMDYLNEQKANLIETTKGILKLDIEAVDSYLETEPPRMVVVYKVFIVAPKLGDYRVKLFTVVEYYDKNRFPVDIYSHLDNDRINNIEEVDFIDKVSEILFTKQMVKNKIQELYKLSVETENKK